MVGCLLHLLRRWIRRGVPDLEMTVDEQIIEHANEEAPKEACGVVVDGVVVRLTNRAPDPTVMFLMDPLEFYGAVTGGHLDAVYHSHPSGNEEISFTDRYLGVDGVEIWVVADGKVVRHAPS